MEYVGVAEEKDEQPTPQDGWFTWPPSPKTQIILFAIGLGIFNLLLILIWAVALYITR